MYNIYLKYGIPTGKKQELLHAIMKKFKRQARADGFVLLNKSNLFLMASEFNPEVPNQEKLESILVRTIVTQHESEKSVTQYDLNEYIGDLLMVMIEGKNGFVITLGYPGVEAYLILYFGRPIERGTEFGVIYKRLNDLVKEMGDDLKGCLR